MNIFNRIKIKKFKEYIDIIKWTDNTPEILIWRHPCYKEQIKNGAELTVDTKQVAVLVSKGKIADVFPPGVYQLTTANMPILATLKRWKYNFNSPFKSDIYFINRSQFRDVEWATETPIVMNEKEFKNIKLYASGTYSFQVNANPIKFVRKILDNDNQVAPECVTDELQKFAINKFTNYLSTSKISIVDLLSNIDEFSSELTIALKNEFIDYGLELFNFTIKEIDLPEEINKKIKSRVEKNSSNNGRAYTQPPPIDYLDSRNNFSDHTMEASMSYTVIEDNSQTSTTIHDEKLTIEQIDNILNEPTGAKTDSSFISQQVNYYIVEEGKQEGPFDKTKLQEMVIEGRLTPETLIWTMGMTRWDKAKSVDSLSEFFRQVPPPPPQSM